MNSFDELQLHSRWDPPFHTSFLHVEPPIWIDFDGKNKTKFGFAPQLIRYSRIIRHFRETTSSDPTSDAHPDLVFTNGHGQSNNSDVISPQTGPVQTDHMIYGRTIRFNTNPCRRVRPIVSNNGKSVTSEGIHHRPDMWSEYKFSIFQFDLLPESKHSEADKLIARSLKCYSILFII